MHTHLALSYEHDLNLYVVERKVSSYFDWIGAAGGVLNGLRIILGVVVALFSYNAYTVYMVSILYHRKTNPKKFRTAATEEITR